MPESARVKKARDLTRCWRQWTGAVAACAHRSVPPGLTVASYGELYDDLLEACRAAAAGASGADREFYQALEGLVRPWLTLEILVRTDQELLADLLGRCQEADRRLRGKQPRPPSRWALSAGSAAVIVLLILATAAVFALDWWQASLNRRFGVVVDDVRYAWRELGETNQWLVVGGLAVLLVLGVVARWVRR
jgi:hypothetical protein